MHRRYDTDDGTGVSAAKKISRRGEPLYVLAHAGLSARPFLEAGFEPVRVEGSFYRLLPPGRQPSASGEYAAR